MGTFIVVVILVLIVAAAVRYLFKSHKRGEHVGCGGDCTSCHSGCSHHL